MYGHYLNRVEQVVGDIDKNVVWTYGGFYCTSCGLRIGKTSVIDGQHVAN